MRVTGGKFRGRVFTPPRVENFRPTMEKVRQAVFSALESLGGIEDSRVLDCYSGSGAFGIEALSRGALNCLFIEKNKKLVAFTNLIIEKLELGSVTEVKTGELPKDLPLSSTGYELIFCDPPYKQFPPRFLEEIMQRNLLSRGGFLVLETAVEKRAETQPVDPAEGLSLTLVRDKRYGDTSIRIYQKN